MTKQFLETEYGLFTQTNKTQSGLGPTEVFVTIIKKKTILLE